MCVHTLAARCERTVRFWRTAFAAVKWAFRTHLFWPHARAATEEASSSSVSTHVAEW